ncbi:MAG: hypothetical protein IJM44_03170 [Ruminococcus sp.]|nr:hypothetical protein [Ruminococcus sp.]
MRYRKTAAALTALLCLTCGCSKNKTPDVPEEEPAGVTEAIETESAPSPKLPRTNLLIC